VGSLGGGAGVQKSDYRQFGLLCTSGERPSRRSAERDQELSSSNIDCQAAL
jgi:hypothetical protein